ncbi:CAAX prenyl protease 1 like protein [Tritrichomonas foetus]|uniref:CAAX prenyl protease n=1 Tax=Tritrichomonas foetus TaxID=1144522 RepID=A0A1J4K4X6_9EUKA|nr:CAAX prenyl protease 1 like protein [Tritrichomonas foetus]|eukprot:OHT04734.1 CAAX prenyl protease 1 like protein [Tritrichomonas foetus]
MWFEFAVIAIVFEILFELYLDYRQLRHLRSVKEPVDIFKADITQEEFKKSVDYQVACTTFSMWSTVLGMGIVSPFIVKLLWDITRYGNEIIHSIIFTCFTTLIESIVSIPFSYYKKFVIDEKFGFNNSTIKLFVTDNIKSFFLNSIISSILYSALVWLYHWAGPKFIPTAFAFFFGFMVLLQVLYPIIIMPLFTKLSPLPDGDVKTTINKLAEETKFNLKEIYQTDDSKRSSKQNAFMMGLFTHKVALADTLLEKCSPEEIKAVVGHEIGHSKHNHIWKLIFINMAGFAITCASLQLIMKHQIVFNDFGFFDEMPIVIGLTLTTFIATPISQLLQLPLNMLIRHFEYQADEFAASRGLKLEEALLKISQENKSAVEPEYIYSAFNDSHPTLFQRVTAIREIQRKSKHD